MQGSRELELFLAVYRCTCLCPSSGNLFEVKRDAVVLAQVPKVPCPLHVKWAVVVRSTAGFSTNHKPRESVKVLIDIWRQVF